MRTPQYVTHPSGLCHCAEGRVWGPTESGERGRLCNPSTGLGQRHEAPLEDEGGECPKSLASGGGLWHTHNPRAAPVDSGGVAERSKAPVLKTGKRKLRGFESHLLRSQMPHFCEVTARLDKRLFLEKGRGEVAERLKALAC